ncbi:fatty-acid amide hydrolase 2-like isoform X1 [Dinothrombium tinctorium]|uniref:Fatty-acid amide hydrolase 2-like isoform X1 n=1 Tax=Dinothrombium tinctorium TaxID=1965070 RepID=A0A3S3Q2K5_9ACAR|nr:fatty-acid amide hydrolase 2-like isoform X1 [Dinothrombium tinctorium]
MFCLNWIAKTICKLIDIICFIYSNLRYPSRRNKIPSVENDFLLIPAIEIAQRIKEVKLKALDVVKAYLTRIEEVNPIINAVIKSRENAIRDAEAIDEKLANERENQLENLSQLPLLGVPFTVKDTVYVKGMPVCAGLVSRKDETAPEDAPSVFNLRQAGAIPIAVTNVPELAMSFDTSNCLFGRTNNPYDLSLIAGGSSGGEGALISSAGSIIGLGSDIGGSIRFPALFCGIFGHKTTPGIVSTDGKYPTLAPGKAPLFSFGPMCRYASDLKPMLKAMAGPRIECLLKIDSNVDLSKLRVFYMLDNGNPWNSRVASETKNAILKVVSHFEKTYGVMCTNVNLEKMRDSFSMWSASLGEAKGTPMSVLMNDNKGEINLFLEIISKIFGRSSHTAVALGFALNEKIVSLLPKTNKISEIKELKQQLIDILGDDGIFLYPCFPEISVKHDTILFKFLNISYTTVFNVTSLPVTQCPLGLSKSGVPLGVQVAANEFNDHLTIAVANEIEKIFGGWVPPFSVNIK